MHPSHERRDRRIWTRDRAVEGCLKEWQLFNRSESSRKHSEDDGVKMEASDVARHKPDQSRRARSESSDALKRPGSNVNINDDDDNLPLG